MPVTPATSARETPELRRGPLHATLGLAPLSVTVARGGRALIREADLWAAEGTVKDFFLQITEGVIPNEEAEAPERAGVASLAHSDPGRLVADTTLEGGRRARVTLELPGEDHVLVTFEPEGHPLRLAAEWDTHPAERFVGLGARHNVRFDQSGRTVELGADRRYTGPDCPEELLAQGGVPQGDCAPAPWMTSSRGYSVWLETFGNGTRFTLGEDRVIVSSRASAGPLRAHLLTHPTPAARLRAYLRLTGFPALLPEWAYGFWKSRDFHEHRDDVIEDWQRFREMGIPLDAIVLDSPWETQYNTWEFNPHQFPDAEQMVREMRADGVRTVVWVTGWVNTDSSDGQIPPQAESEALHRGPSPNYAEAEAGGHLVRDAGGEPFVTRWWMGNGSLVDLTRPASEEWWREQAKRVLALGVEGIKADDGDGYYLPEELRLHDGRTGAQAAWDLGDRHRRCLQRALDEVHPGRGVLFGRSGWSGQQATGLLWGGDQVSDFWSLRVLVAASLSAAASGFSNWSHDVGGYLGHRLVDRCPPELLVRWLQVGCFTPLMHAHGQKPQEPWHYSDEVAALYRGYVHLHEQLVPYIRAAAATAERTGLPILRPLCLTDPGDPRGWSVSDAYGFGPALWVAPVLEESLREREVSLPRGRWVQCWSGLEEEGGGEVVAPAPVETVPVWVRAGSIVVTHPPGHVARGLGDVPERERPLRATLWGEPALGRAAARLADGTRIDWVRGRWRCDAEREVEFVVR